MTRKALLLVSAFGLAATLSSCSSGGGGKSCKLTGEFLLADSDWPKFHRDAANTGRAAVDLSVNSGEPLRLFPGSGITIGAIANTPILASDRILLGSTDGTVYVLDYAGTPLLLDEDDLRPMTGAITASPVMGKDSTGQEGPFAVALGEGTLVQFRSDGSARYATTLGAFVSGSPGIGSDGTIYVGNLGGTFSAVCPNGGVKFVLSATATESSAAVVNDPEDDKDRIIVFGANNGQVRALDQRGRQRWSFFASAAVQAAIVMDVPSDRLFVADQAGRVFSVDIGHGERREDFSFQAGAPIFASPALGGDTRATPSLYVADQAGTLYAVDRASGAVRWTFDAGAQIFSSPAVATGGASDVVVFGADVRPDTTAAGGIACQTPGVTSCGIVYAVADSGTGPSLLWATELEHPVGHSSPSLRSDGTVYIGTEGGILYSLGQ